MASHIISGTTSMVLLLTFVLIAPRGLGSRLDACDPVVDSTVVVQAVDDTSTDVSYGDPHPITPLQLLQVIDTHPQYMVILPSGKSIDDHQLEAQNVKLLHIFDQDNWQSSFMAMKMLQALGWRLDVVKAPGVRDAIPSTPKRDTRRFSSRVNIPNEIKIVFAYPPISIAEDPFQSIVIELKNASLDDTFKALREMRSWWTDERFDVVATPSTNSIVLFASDPVLLERCKILVDQMEQVASSQQAKQPPKKPRQARKEQLRRK
ncbi:MAG: hypothetical protein VX949_10630 [Planctomycetota bacterium]|nr:hypothetical protein [Planctomycetota bacterium]